MDVICLDSQEALAHVHDGLVRGSRGSFIDDGPDEKRSAVVILRGAISRTRRPDADQRLALPGETGPDAEQLLTWFGRDWD